jgi:hypothetical protein
MTLLVLLAALAAEAPARHASSAAGRAAPAILADYARAIGGDRAWRRHKTLYLKRAIVAKGMEISGTEERYATAAGQMVTVSEIPQMGRFRQGCDGKVCWSEDPINGLRILSGVEDEEARIDGAWQSEAQLARSYEKVRSIAPPEPPPAGKRYECVELVPKSAPPAVTCFDASTHLRVFQKGTRAGPQGAVPYVTRFSDWRGVQGIKIPYGEETTAGPLTIDARVVEVKLDGPLAPALFAVPRADGGAKTGP